MARYLQTAARYQAAAAQLYDLLPEQHKERGADLIARLVNAGVVSCPRGVQGTVRLNIVRTVCEPIDGLRVGLQDRQTEDGRTYKALVTNYEPETEAEPDAPV